MPGAPNGRTRLAELNDQLTCKLCRGYFIDATTIVECLHSFCKSCIVKYLKTNKYCPICEVQVHECKPLLGIKPDYTLQDIVYKLVPGCYQNEMRCRREFYDKYPEAKIAGMSPEARGEPIESHIYSADELLNLSLEYYNPTYNNGINIIKVFTESSNESTFSTDKSLSKIYLRCPAAVTVYHLQKLIRAKYELTEAHKIDFMYKEELLCTKYTLMDVMYIYHWRRKVPLNLNYRIFKPYSKDLEPTNQGENLVQNDNNENCQKTSIDISNNSDNCPTEKKCMSNESTNIVVNNVPMIMENLNQSQSSCVGQQLKNLVIINSSLSNSLKLMLPSIVTPTTSINLQSFPIISLSNTSQSCHNNINNTNNKDSRIYNDSNNNNNNSSNDNLSINHTTTVNTNVVSVPSCFNSNFSDQTANSNPSSTSTMSKMEVLPKGTKLNKICAKIASGSKINNICAKFSKLSKRKSKVEKSKSVIPTLLKFTKITGIAASSDIVKQIAGTADVSIYKPNSIPTSKINKSTNEQSALPVMTSSSALITSTLPSSMSAPTTSALLTFTTSTSTSLNVANSSLHNNDIQNGKMSLNVSTISSNNNSPKIAGKKPAIVKPPRMFKTKPVSKYCGSSELSIKSIHSSDNSSDTKDQSQNQLSNEAKSLGPMMTSMITPIDTSCLIVSPSVSLSSNRSIENSCITTNSTNSPLSHTHSTVGIPHSSFFYPTILSPDAHIIYPQFSSAMVPANVGEFTNHLPCLSIDTESTNTYQMNILPSLQKMYSNASNNPCTTSVTYPPGITIRPVFTPMQKSSSTYSSPITSPTTTDSVTSNISVATAPTVKEIANHCNRTSHDVNAINRTTSETRTDPGSNLVKGMNTSTTVGELSISAVMSPNAGKSTSNDEKSIRDISKESCVKNEKKKSDKKGNSDNEVNKEEKKEIRNQGNDMFIEIKLERVDEGVRKGDVLKIKEGKIIVDKNVSNKYTLSINELINKKVANKIKDKDTAVSESGEKS